MKSSINPDTNKKLTWQAIKHLISFAVILAVFFLFAFQLKTNWHSLHNLGWTRHPWMIFFHVLFTVIYYSLIILGWHFLMKFSGSSVGFLGSAATWLFANLGKYIPGKVFMLAGRVEFCRRIGVRRSISFTAMLYEHILHLIVTFPFMVWAMIQGFQLDTKWGLVAIILIMLICFIIFFFPHLLLINLNVLLKKLNRELLEFSPKFSQLFIVAGIYSAAWIAYGFSGVMLGKGLNLIGPTPSLIVIIAFVASWMIGFLSMLTPGGIGVREGVMVLLLAPYISTPQAIVLAIIARLTWTCVELLGILLGFCMLKRHEAPE